MPIDSVFLIKVVFKEINFVSDTDVHIAPTNKLRTPALISRWLKRWLDNHLLTGVSPRFCINDLCRHRPLDKGVWSVVNWVPVFLTV